MTASSLLNRGPHDATTQTDFSRKNLWKTLGQDPQRTLTAEGTRTVEHMAEYLSLLRLELVRIEHSDKQRAANR
jgi:phosphohistidine phosphatase SixA